IAARSVQQHPVQRETRVCLHGDLPLSTQVTWSVHYKLRAAAPFFIANQRLHDLSRPALRARQAMRRREHAATGTEAQPTEILIGRGGLSFPIRNQAWLIGYVG